VLPPKKDAIPKKEHQKDRTATTINSLNKIPPALMKEMQKTNRHRPDSGRRSGIYRCYENNALKREVTKKTTPPSV
jgi:hypothetical protein